MTTSNNMVQELLSRHNIFYYERGDKYIVRCLNPEHEDRNPSMQIQATTGNFKCWSCQIWGAFPKLQRLLGETPSVEESGALTVKVELLKRKLTMGSTSVAEPLQFPRSCSVHPGPYRNIGGDTLFEFHVFVSNSQEFQGRVWFPIHHRGRLIAFQGRAETPELEPKYIFYPRGVDLRSTIMGIESIPKKTVILTEGIIDMMRLRDAGIKEACCIFGSYFGLEKVYTLLANDIQVVITMFDPDAAGKKVTTQTQQLLQKKAPNIAVIPIWLSGDKDPGAMWDDEIYELLTPYKGTVLQ